MKFEVSHSYASAPFLLPRIKNIANVLDSSTFNTMWRRTFIVISFKIRILQAHLLDKFPANVKTICLLSNPIPRTQTVSYRS